MGYAHAGGASPGVAELDYPIGGEDNVDLGSPAPPGAPGGGAGTSSVVQEAKLPNIDVFGNQVQAANECAPGAISNSRKYLQAAGNPTLSQWGLVAFGGLLLAAIYRALDRRREA